MSRGRLYQRVRDSPGSPQSVIHRGNGTVRLSVFPGRSLSELSCLVTIEFGEFLEFFFRPGVDLFEEFGGFVWVGWNTGHGIHLVTDVEVVECQAVVQMHSMAAKDASTITV